MYSFVKSSMISVAAIIAAVGIANATDLPSKRGFSFFPAPPKPVVEQPYDWSGFYIGGNGELSIPNTTNDNTVYGGLAGVNAGYNYQMDHYVFGVEGSTAYGKINQFNQPNAWLSSVDGVAGYAFDKVLPYVKAGPSYYSNWNNNVSWNVGAGVKFGLTKNVDVFSEYDYYNLGKSNGNKLNTSLVKLGAEYKF